MQTSEIKCVLETLDKGAHFVKASLKHDQNLNGKLSV